MRRIPWWSIFSIALLVGVLPAGASGAIAPPVTKTGIPLDAPWKVSLYKLATTSFKHPAWGWQHSERNYDIALQLAKGDRITVDDDVLFAAAFLHDMAAFPPYAKTGVEHGERAAQTSEAVLRRAGFPMQKFAAVQAAERGHMYYSNPGSLPESIVLHDADSLDFLGAIGAARMIALTGDTAAGFGDAIATLRGFLHDIPPRLITKSARTIGAQRAAELRRILAAVDAESFKSRAL